MSNKPNITNLGIGAAVSLFEVTTLGQPLEVLKTHMASHRGDSLRTAISKTYARGKFAGFYQGLIPWAWIESSAAGATLLFTSSIIEDTSIQHGISPGTAGLLGGMSGGLTQAYLVMGVCTCMKTAEVTRAKVSTRLVSSIVGHPPRLVAPPSTFSFFMNTYRAEGIRGINKGVNAVALRQMSNWGSRMGFARAAEGIIRDMRGLQLDQKLSIGDKIGASAIGGVLGCWNQPIEVVRVEMQSLAKSTSADRPAKLTIANTFKYIYKESGIKGLFKGVTPRIGLSVYRTICLVTLADWVKDAVKARA